MGRKRVPLEQRKWRSRTRERCARCGHTTPRCDACNVHVEYLGGWGADGKRYCHSFVDVTPTCYTLASWEWTEANVRPDDPLWIAGRLARQARTEVSKGDSTA